MPKKNDNKSKTNDKMTGSIVGRPVKMKDIELVNRPTKSKKK